MTLRSSDEVLIREMVDTYGPVAVAICGGSDSLMFYRSGILDDVSSCVDQTHAVLVVGYGKWGGANRSGRVYLTHRDCLVML